MSDRSLVYDGAQPTSVNTAIPKSTARAADRRIVNLPVFRTRDGLRAASVASMRGTAYLRLRRRSRCRPLETSVSRSGSGEEVVAISEDKAWRMYVGAITSSE